jgi:hypothetical protein
VQINIINKSVVSQFDKSNHTIISPPNPLNPNPHSYPLAYPYALITLGGDGSTNTVSSDIRSETGQAPSSTAYGSKPQGKTPDDRVAKVRWLGDGLSGVMVSVYISSTSTRVAATPRSELGLAACDGRWRGSQSDGGGGRRGDVGVRGS